MGTFDLQTNKNDNLDLFFDEYQKNNLIKIKNDFKSYFEKIDQEIFLSS